MRYDYVSQQFGDTEIVTLAIGDNYVYVVACVGEVMVADPPAAGPVLRLLSEKKWNLSKVINTHGHFDHTGGNVDLQSKTGCQVFAPREAHISGVDYLVGDGDVIKLGAMDLNVIATPGHGEGDVSYYAPPSSRKRPGIVWTGDTLFIGGCGRVFGCDYEAMWNSLNALAGLPDSTLVYCGHEYTLENYRFARGLEPENKQVEHRLEAVKKLLAEGKPTVPSTIASEKRTNPFLRASHQQMKDTVGMPEADDVEVFTHLRRWKDAF